MVLQLRVGELLGVFAYNQTFTLIENLLMVGFLMLLGAILPPRYLRDDFIFKGSFVVFFSALWAILFQGLEPFVKWLQPRWTQSLGVLDSILSQGILDWISSESYLLLVVLSIWGTWYLGILGLIPFLAQSYSRFRKPVLAFVDRLAVPSTFFVTIDLVGIILVMARNLL
jgi:hypothetical protein